MLDGESEETSSAILLFAKRPVRKGKMTLFPLNTHAGFSANSLFESDH
jgi:hypothetical protein